MKRILLVLAAAAIASLGNVRAEMVTYYSFNGNANDSSGHNNNAIVHDAILTTDRFGTPNSAYQFDGINDYISASSTGLPTADRTIAFWFNATSFANHPVFLGYGGAGCGTGFFVGANATKAIYNDRLYVSSHCDINNLLYHYAAAPVGSWTHFCIDVEFVRNLYVH